MNKNKFKLTPSPIMAMVRESYIQFMGLHWDDLDLIKLFKDKVNESTKLTVHANLLMSLENMIVIETSKYLEGGVFTDHQLWVFYKWMDQNKEGIYLNRYNIND